MRKALKLLLGSSVLAIATTAALAADLPSRRVAPAFVPPPPAFTWTGFYVGLNAGAAFDQHRGPYAFSNAGNANTINGSGGTSGILTLGGSRTGFTGGGQAGYNYQFNPGSSIVVGVEADIQYKGDFGSSSNGFGFVPTTPLSYGLAFASRIPGAGAGLPDPTIRTGTDFFGTARGRLGYAFDRVLVYGTGGFAYGDHGATGYAVGGGLEYAVTNNVSIRGEYLYVNLDRSGFNANYNLTTNVLTINGGRDNFSVARAGVNFRFDSPLAPVVARY